MGIADNLIFHNWVPYSLMPQYLSSGNLTISIGNFAESFPNISLESIACGTPSVSSRVAAHRSTLPESIEPRADYGDIETTAEIALEILTNPRFIDIRAGIDYIDQKFNFKQMLESYEKAITGCRKRRKLPIEINVNVPPAYSVPPWCYLSSKFGLYNDFKGSYVSDLNLINLLRKNQNRIPSDNHNRDILLFHEREGNLIASR